MGFLDRMHTPEVLEFFKALSIIAEKDSCASLFEVLDADGSGAVDASEFVDRCVRLTGPLEAWSFAIAMKDQSKDIQEMMGTMQSVLEVLEHNRFVPRSSVKTRQAN